MQHEKASSTVQMRTMRTTCNACVPLCRKKSNLRHLLGRNKDTALLLSDLFEQSSCEGAWHPIRKEAVVQCPVSRTYIMAGTACIFCIGATCGAGIKPGVAVHV